MASDQEVATEREDGQRRALVQVAVDGPSASGKSTVSRRVAEALGFLYVDSGSLYRAVTWKTLQEGIPSRDPQAVTAMLDGCTIRSVLDGRTVRFELDGSDPGTELRSDVVVDRVSDIAAIPAVRARIVLVLRDAAALGNLVMEGRDIGTVVFPDTPLKFFLDADPAERARRRYLEQPAGDSAADLQQVMSSLKRRDQKDTTRASAPLAIAPGAHVINTTGLSIDEVVDRILGFIRAREEGS